MWILPNFYEHLFWCEWLIPNILIIISHKLIWKSKSAWTLLRNSLFENSIDINRKEQLIQLSRSSRPEIICKKVAKFKGKHLCQSLFFNKVAGLRRMDQKKISKTVTDVCEICNPLIKRIGWVSPHSWLFLSFCKFKFTFFAVSVL